MQLLLWSLRYGGGVWLVLSAALLLGSFYLLWRWPRIRGHSVASAVHDALSRSPRTDLDERHLEHDVVLRGTLVGSDTGCASLIDGAPVAATAAFPDSDQPFPPPHTPRAASWAPGLALQLEGRAVPLTGPILPLVGSQQRRAGVPLGWLRRGVRRRISEAFAHERMAQQLERASLQVHALAFGEPVLVRGKLSRRLDVGANQGYRDLATQYVLAPFAPPELANTSKPMAVELCYDDLPRISGPSPWRLAVLPLLVVVLFAALTSALGVLAERSLTRSGRDTTAQLERSAAHRPYLSLAIAALSPLHRRLALDYFARRVWLERDLPAATRLHAALELNRLRDQCSANFELLAPGLRSGLAMPGGRSELLASGLRSRLLASGEWSELLASGERSELLRHEVDSCSDPKAPYVLSHLRLLRLTSQWLTRYELPAGARRDWYRWAEAHLAAGRYTDGLRQMEPVLAARIARIRTGARRMTNPGREALIAELLGLDTADDGSGVTPLLRSPPVARLRSLTRITRLLQLVEPALAQMQRSAGQAMGALTGCPDDLRQLLELDARQAWFRRWSAEQRKHTAASGPDEAATLDLLLARSVLDLATLLGARRQGCSPSTCATRLSAVLADARPRLEFLAKADLLPRLLRTAKDLQQDGVARELVASSAMLAAVLGREGDALALVRHQGQRWARAAGFAVLWPSARLRLLPQLERLIRDEGRSARERRAVLESLESCTSDEKRALCELLRKTRHSPSAEIASIGQRRARSLACPAPDERPIREARWTHCFERSLPNRRPTAAAPR
jgi:hypothetical protein